MKIRSLPKTVSGNDTLCEYKSNMQCLCHIRTSGLSIGNGQISLNIRQNVSKCNERGDCSWNIKKISRKRQLLSMFKRCIVYSMFEKKCIKRKLKEVHEAHIHIT